MTDVYGPADGARLAEVNEQIVDDYMDELARRTPAALLIPTKQRRLRIPDRPADSPFAAVLPNIWVEADFRSGGLGMDTTRP
jgi:hypothetical protein